MENKPPIYPYSVKEARERGELAAWRESFRENCTCAGGIEISIRDNFDGMYLKDGAVSKIIEQFGYKRVAYVLANTVQELSYDGRFSPANKDWANGHYVPRDTEHNACFVVRSHPAIVDGFLTEYRRQFMELGLFQASQCEPDSIRKDYTGKVLALSPNALKEQYWSPQNQLWLAQSGFGCSPTASGRAVYGICLGDGEKARWNRNEFLGVVKEEFLPDWARENLKQYQQLEQMENREMQMGGMG